MVLLAVACCGPAAAQPLVGVYWDQPENSADAMWDIRQMHASGVEAIRTRVITHEEWFQLADSLGLAFFQDLPIAYMPGSRLADSLAFARASLDTAVAFAGRFESARFIGLAENCDSQHATFEGYIQSVTQNLTASQRERVRLYYSTPYPQRGPAADLVDFVLFDALDHPEPASLLGHPNADMPQRTGIAMMGTWADGIRRGGYRVPHTLEHQARYIESHLNDVLNTYSEAVAVFVYRWSDARPAQPDGRLHDTAGRGYGLLDADGLARPAHAVVDGIFTGRQNVFAFPAGTPPAQGPVDWIILLSWSILALLAMVYATSPLCRQMLRRYFLSRTFYCHAVREGRELFAPTNAVILGCFSLAGGITAAVILLTLTEGIHLRYILHWLQPRYDGVFLMLVERPGLAILATAAAHAAFILFWTTWLMILSRRRKALSASQAFIIALWPQWPGVVVMAAGLIVVSIDQPISGLLMMAVGGCMLVVVTLGLVKSLGDLVRVGSLPGPSTYSLGLLPIAACAIYFLYATTILAGDELVFLWNLLFIGL